MALPKLGEQLTYIKKGGKGMNPIPSFGSSWAKSVVQARNYSIIHELFSFLPATVMQGFVNGLVSKTIVRFDTTTVQDLRNRGDTIGD